MFAQAHFISDEAVHFWYEMLQEFKDFDLLFLYLTLDIKDNIKSKKNKNLLWTYLQKLTPENTSKD